MSVLPCDAEGLLLAAEEEELLQQQEGEESKDNDYEDQATEDDDCNEAGSDTVMPESSVKTLNLGPQFIPPIIQIDLVGSKSPSPIDDYKPRYYVKVDNEKEEAIHSDGSTIDIEQKEEEEADELDQTELREFALSYVKDIVSRALSSAEQKTVAKVEQPITASVGDSLQDPSAPLDGSTRTASTVDALPRPSAGSDATATKVVEPWYSRLRESIYRFFRLTCLCSALRRPPPS